jgi:ABC-2 type transport system permease protein
MSKEYHLKKICLSCLAVVAIVLVAIYFIAGDAFRYTATASSTIDTLGVVGEIIEENEIRQPFTIDTDRMTYYQVRFGTYGRSNDSTLTLQICAADGSVLAENVISADTLEESADYTVTLEEPIVGRKGESAVLVVHSDATLDNAVSLYYGNSINLGRGSVTQQYSEDQKVSVNGNTLDGVLYLIVGGQTTLWFGQYYWCIAGGFFALLCIYCVVILRKDRLGKKSATVNFIRSLYRYEFLIKQLVSRDFKTKYRRSVLGVFWSFLNPLLTMMVQYVVFSTLFRSSIPHYPVYLLSGIVLYNFFSEVTSVGMTSITSNASLITKVYVPKYIYPLTRMLSSTINVALSLIPLFIVAIATGVFPALSWLLMVFNLLCMMSFSLGISYILSTLMVYFRDTQFLWSVVSMIWMYCTPIFYPESIIPSQFKLIYHMNPLYQLISFARTALIDGVSPGPKSYLICLLVAILPLVIGVWIFNRNEKNFVLYL